MAETPSPNSKAESKSKSVHLVVQRYRSCRILLEESDWISVGSKEEQDSCNNSTSGGISSSPHCGLLVYVSLAHTAEEAVVRQVAQTVLNLPVVTTGHWGDGVSETVSLLQLAMLNHPSMASIVLVPQANLISKVRNESTSVYVYFIVN
jgi:hypothetical protein